MAEQNRARELRAESWTLQDIADELGVAKSSVSLWVRDVVSQFGKPYRAPPDPSIRLAKHPCGCGYVWYYSTRVHRGVMGLAQALLSCETVLPG